MRSSRLVDVFLLTYNHERYIAQALDGVLAQRFAGDLHVTILEDFSTDGTRAIVQDYAARHPDRITLRLHERNLCSNLPLLEQLRASRARYVATVDGDDYWTAVDKLERQVAFLEANPDCALSYHNVQVVYDDGRAPHLKNPPGQPPFSSIHDLFVRDFIATCSVLYRREALADIPAWYVKLWAADWNLHLLAARHGRIGYLSEPMAVYRVHAKGYWSQLSPVDQWRKSVEILQQMLDHYEPQYHDDIRRGLLNVYQYQAHAEAAYGDLRGALHTLNIARAIDGTTGIPPRLVRVDVQRDEAGTALSLHCEGADRTTFAVIDGAPLPTQFVNARLLRAMLPASRPAGKPEVVEVVNLRGSSNQVEVLA